MIQVRFQNDIPFVWRFFTKVGDEKVPYDLEGRDIAIVMTDAFGAKSSIIPEISGNQASWIFYGKDQKKIGDYTLTFYENRGQVGMKALDKIKPFSLVREMETVQSGTVEGCCSSLDVSPLVLESELGTSGSTGTGSYPDLTDKPKINGVTLIGNKTSEDLGLTHPYLSLERVRPFLYRISFDALPEPNGGGLTVGGCSAFVQNGKLNRNFDFHYDNAASFIVRTKDFEGMAMITGLDDGALDDALLAKLPYRMVDGRNNNGIMVSVHLLFNDWSYTGAGDKSIPLTQLPFEVLTRVKSMATVASDLSGVLGNLNVVGMGDYLIQMLVTDGTTTYALIPPESDGLSYVLVDATANPKMSNFRWVADAQVERANLQLRPTGVERWNLMPCDLSDLRFTKCYESDARLSEFIGIEGTTKDSQDAELEAIYYRARAKYLTRERDGQTWQTVHSVVYGDKMEGLWIQEIWTDNVAVLTDAPSDGKTYGRKNGQWVEIE